MIDDQRVEHPLERSGPSSAWRRSQSSARGRRRLCRPPDRPLGRRPRPRNTRVAGRRDRRLGPWQPRARAGRACWRSLDGRDFVVPADVELLFLPVLGHRVVFTPSSSPKRAGRAGSGDGRVRAADARLAPPRRRVRRRTGSPEARDASAATFPLVSAAVSSGSHSVPCTAPAAARAPTSPVAPVPPRRHPIASTGLHRRGSRPPARGRIHRPRALRRRGAPRRHRGRPAARRWRSARRASLASEGRGIRARGRARRGQRRRGTWLHRLLEFGARADVVGWSPPAGARGRDDRRPRAPRPERRHAPVDAVGGALEFLADHRRSVPGRQLRLRRLRLLAPPAETRARALDPAGRRARGDVRIRSGSRASPTSTHRRCRSWTTRRLRVVRLRRGESQVWRAATRSGLRTSSPDPLARDRAGAGVVGRARAVFEAFVTWSAEREGAGRLGR